MTSFGLLAVAIASLAVTCLAAIGGRALAEFSPHELKEICRRRNRPDPLGQILRRREQVALAVQTLRTLAAAAFAGAVIVWTRPAAQAAPDALAVSLGLLAGAALLLAAGIWIPWAVARLWAEPFLYLTWPLWWATSWLLWPLVLVARLVDLALHRLAGRENPPADQESFDEDIRTIVTEGHREGLLEEEAREMIEGVIELGDADVARIMTPRTDMVSLAAALSWPEMLDAGHQGRPHADPGLRPQPRRHPGHPARQGPAGRAGQAGPVAGRALDQAAARAGLRARDQAHRRPAAGAAAEPQPHGRGAGRVRRRLGPGDHGRRAGGDRGRDRRRARRGPGRRHPRDWAPARARPLAVPTSTRSTSGSAWNCPRTPTTTPSAASSSASWATCRSPASSSGWQNVRSRSSRPRGGGSSACGSSCSTRPIERAVRRQRSAISFGPLTADR